MSTQLKRSGDAELFEPGPASIRPVVSYARMLVLAMRRFTKNARAQISSSTGAPTVHSKSAQAE